MWRRSSKGIDSIPNHGRLGSNQSSRPAPCACRFIRSGLSPLTCMVPCAAFPQFPFVHVVPSKILSSHRCLSDCPLTSGPCAEPMQVYQPHPSVGDTSTVAVDVDGASSRRSASRGVHTLCVRYLGTLATAHLQRVRFLQFSLLTTSLAGAVQIPHVHGIALSCVR